MSAIESCRTAAIGRHVSRCQDCAYTTIAYNSCRNRHCPKCQGAAAKQWLAERQAELLPVPYFHLVFTLPARIAAIAYQNKAVVYDLLFRAAADTVLTIAADPKHLGARIGITAVLHTWGSTMTHHPHLHMIVPGGGISLDGSRWLSCRPRFFLPVSVFSKLFRGLMLAKLLAAHKAGQLKFFGQHAHLADRKAFAAYLAPLRRRNWYLYSKPPFGGPEAVLAYLSRYTHRVAISNRRLIAFDQNRVTFKYKDYRADARARYKLMTLATGEFIRRFLIHVLPKGFHRIRHSGLFAKASCADNKSTTTVAIRIDTSRPRLLDCDDAASISPPAGPQPVAIPLAQLRRAAINASLQPPHSATVPTINPSCCCLPVAASLAPRRIALLRTHLPRQPNPHNRGRGASAYHRPRVRSLPAFGRRPPCTWLRRSWPASETLRNRRRCAIGDVVWERHGEWPPICS